MAPGPATPSRPRTLLRRTSSRGSVSSLESLAFSSSKPSTPTTAASAKTARTFDLLPPPSQHSQPPRVRSSRRTASSSPARTPPRDRPTPRERPTPSLAEPSRPRPPASKRAKRDNVDRASHSTCQQRSEPAPPALGPTPRQSSVVEPGKLSPRFASSLLTTPWQVLDPDNSLLLSSSRLFQVSHLELGAVTRDQNGGKDRKYGESQLRERKSGNAARQREARKVLDKLERDRVERLPAAALQARQPPASSSKTGEYLETSWAKTRDGVEWEAHLLKKLSSRLSKPLSGLGTGEDFIPLVSAIDLEQNLRKMASEHLECWILGREFPCRRVVLTGWVLDREWKESGDRKRWIYTVDDGTALVQVICHVDDAAGSCQGPESRTSIQPLLDPQPRIPKYRLPETTPSSGTATVSPLPGSASNSDARKRSYAMLEATATSNETVFPPHTLVRVVGSIAMPDYRSSELRLTADRIEAVSPRHELEHHAAVNELWNAVYSKAVDVRGMLERIDREEKELERHHDRNAPSSTAGSEYASGDVSESSTSNVRQALLHEVRDCNLRPLTNSLSFRRQSRYRPTRPSKLCSEDVTLSNFVVYIRHHLVKSHVHSATAIPPPSSQGSIPDSDDDNDNDNDNGTVRRQEICLPFTIDNLRQNKHLELFARRLSLEKDRKEYERSKEQRKRRRRDGGFSLLDSTKSRIDGGGGDEGSVWIPKEREAVGRPTKESKNRVVTGSAKLVNLMLPPPLSTPRVSSLSTSQPARSRPYHDEDVEDPVEQELAGKKLERAMRRCWEDAIRLMTKNGMIVEYVPGEHGPPVEEDEDNASHSCDRKAGMRHHRDGGDSGDDDEGLPDEPRHSGRYRQVNARGSGRTGATSVRNEATPRASSRVGYASSRPSTSDTQVSTYTRQWFQLVTPISILPVILHHFEELSFATSSSSSSSRRGLRSVTELDVRLALYRDDRWSAVAKYGEVVRRALEVLEGWGTIRSIGEGYKFT
ncbi:hypothetical protein JCM11491_001342 [Sporobolomyces phaffii]